MNKHSTGTSFIQLHVWAKCLFCILGVSLCCYLKAQNKVTNPFLTLRYDSVVLYDYEGGKDAFLMNSQNKLNISVIKKHVYFNRVESIAFSKKLGRISSYGGGEASCFDPHFGVVYYRHHKTVAYIEVCLGCNRLRSSLRLFAQEQLPQGNKNERFYLGGGMSKSFRKYINGILVRYHFSNQL